MMKKRVILAMLLLCQGCLTSPDVSGNASGEQTFLFEISYTNYAWGYQLRGLYIDRQGQVYSYDHSHAVWQPSDPQAYTEEELLQKFESRKELTGTVEEDTLAGMFRLIESASQGRLSEPVQKCADAGTTAYLAYRFDKDSGKYISVLLYQTGDWAQKNLSDSAKTLYEWLFTFEGWEPGACLPQ